ncbi:MAG: LysM peptidoglycan-binding domain-containing protein [Cellulosilyticum sp.]|nr:LysM peptidoglycan-binding domain-containing protein [Cellulosilyticum sp.]
MGKVSYRPKRNHNKSESKKQQGIKNSELNICETGEETVEVNFEDTVQEVERTAPKISVVGNRKNQHKLDSIKVIGDLECEYHIYIEDYVYTYIYQLASADLARESSAMLIGEIFNDSKEAIIRAVIPVNMDKLEEGAEWIDINTAEEIESQRKSYFADQDIIGWMHMQPGYGTMLTMKELREHQSVFEGNGTICMLVDAINKIETLFVYEEDELKEQSGYCMYYERNEEMQQFMLDHPFIVGAKEEMKDTVVNQFREIGKIRKAEYTQRKNLNLTVMAASVILIALTAFIVKMNDSKKYVDASQVGQLTTVDLNNEASLAERENTFLTQPALDQVSNDAVGIEGEQAEGINTQEGVAGLGNENVLSEEVNNEEQMQEGVETSDIELQKEETNALANVESDYSIYIVETGDTLADICYKQYGSAERSLEVAKFNGLSNTNQIYVGQELKMPK